MFVYVGGVRGVGKTSALLQVVRSVHDRKVEWVQGSEIMRQLAGLSTIEELRSLSESERAQLRPQMINHLYDLDADDPKTIRLGDGHYCYFDSSGENVGIRPIHARDRQHIRCFAVVTASTRSVQARRFRDQAIRGDRQLDRRLIRHERRLELAVARMQAETLNKPLLIIDATHKDVLQVAKRLWQFIYSVELGFIR